MAIVIYFVPSIVAYSRGAQNFLAIFLLNLFLGWSLLGWVGSLIWALLDEKKGYPCVPFPHAPAATSPQAVAAQPQALATIASTSEKSIAFCSQCGQTVGPDDRFCAHCGHALQPVP
ncbi:superinfection immunity protein [Acidithiobacillus sp. IBUN Pt1247-S3]|uniref:superinfection immunity protein n=1 Tax=Acidithiobacillus sp. IBUN Pt1247-S3 TaxID=3166642 RepID=UPI0034E46FB7